MRYLGTIYWTGAEAKEVARPVEAVLDAAGGAFSLTCDFQGTHYEVGLQRRIVPVDEVMGTTKEVWSGTNAVPDVRVDASVIQDGQHQTWRGHWQQDQSYNLRIELDPESLET